MCNDFQTQIAKLFNGFRFSSIETSLCKFVFNSDIPKEILYQRLEDAECRHEN